MVYTAKPSIAKRNAEIYALKKSGMTTARIAGKYSMTQTRVYQICAEAKRREAAISLATIDP